MTENLSIEVNDQKAIGINTVTFKTLAVTTRYKNGNK